MDERRVAELRILDRLGALGVVGGLDLAGRLEHEHATQWSASGRSMG
jgi:hypothetical protein